MKNIVITSDKGGVGKSTITALIVEWLNFTQSCVSLIDADPIQTSRTWLDNCLADGRAVESKELDTGKNKYCIIDTAGTSGAGLSWLQKADLIVAPFQPHYADINIVSNWFTGISNKLQQKVLFVPNRYQKTNEQKEGIEQVQKILSSERAGLLLNPIHNRPAIYGALLNGSAINFFKQNLNKSVIDEAKLLTRSIIEICNDRT